jgi:hypothetical protein
MHHEAGRALRLLQSSPCSRASLNRLARIMKVSVPLQLFKGVGKNQTLYFFLMRVIPNLDWLPCNVFGVFHLRQKYATVTDYFSDPFTAVPGPSHIEINERFRILRALSSSFPFLAFSLSSHQGSRAALNSLRDNTPSRTQPSLINSTCLVMLLSTSRTPTVVHS